MKNAIHLSISEKIPYYHDGTKKTCKRKIQDIMRQYGYDDDVIESISDDFARGFGVARDIAVEILKEQYYSNQELTTTEDETHV